ncbi:MAG: hypothetical protein IJJ26_05570, partial [Victivallales bacterium]|nr:hypothetical protein [Victivallales bacterium]
ALFLEFFGKAIEVADIYVARTAMAIVIVLAIELILSVIIEFYRPRMPGEEERPLPESRILALFTEPGGIARNVAASLDYQFGFDVSEAWFYHFLERTVVPLLVIMALTLWLQTCLVVVSTEENGIMERFGKVVSMEPLPPGLYFKLPSPFERLNRFPVERIQSITINGHDIVEEHEEEEEAKADEHDDGHGHNQKPEKKNKEEEERVVLWSTSHDDHEQPFIVAMKQEAQQVAKEGAGAPPLSIGLMAAHIPMYYKVRSKDFYNYYYKHNNPGKTLRNIATRELLSFMAQSDFTEVLGGRRHEAGKILQNRIQKIADEMELGVDIVFVSLAGLHPPVSVGSAYDNVEAAQETKHQQILLAKAYAAGSAPAAQSVRASLINQAEAYKQDRIRVSSAEAERFDRQLKGYLAAPRIFKLNTYLDEFLTSSANTRKFILAGNPHEEVFNLDLEKKISSSLLDLNLDEDEPPAGNDNPSAAPAQ